MMKLKKKFIFTMVFLPAVMLSFMGSGPFGPLTCPGPTMDIWEATLEEFEAGAASMKSTELTNGEHWVNLDVREDEWPSDCFERIAAVLKQNPYKSFKIFMKDKKIADTLSALPEKVFEGCVSLIGIEVPNQITCIGKESFKDCTRFHYLARMDYITKIDDGAFKGCVGAIFIHIPKTVTTMGKNVFDGWTDRQTIYVPFAEGEENRPSGWDTDWNKNSDGTEIKAKIEYRQP